MSFWRPVKNGWQLLQMSRCTSFDVERVCQDAPQAQFAGLRVELGADVVFLAVAGAGGALDRVLHRLDDDAAVDQLFARDRVGDGEQLGP